MYIVHRHCTMTSGKLIKIDLSSEVPAYEQIAAEIRALLVAGELQAGDALPTVRQLALDLAVHHNTVAQAYRILGDEGWLELRRGRGVRVLPRSTPTGRGNSGKKGPQTFSLHLRRLLAKAAADGISPEVLARQLTLHARDVKNWAKGNI
jgi:GntR family transcriptional regulator